MALHYHGGVLRRVLSATETAAVAFHVRVAGTIAAVYLDTEAVNATGASVFDVNLEGTSIWAADQTQRVKFVTSAVTGSVTGLAVAVTAGQFISVDVDALNGGTLGSASAPVTVTIVIDDGVSSGGTGTRTTYATTTSSLAANATANVDAAITPSLLVKKIITSTPARVRAYMRSIDRTEDAARSSAVYPSGEHGLIFDVVTETGALTWRMSPEAIGGNNDTTTANTIYLAIQNTDIVSRAVTVTIHYLALEAAI